MIFPTVPIGTTGEIIRIKTQEGGKKHSGLEKCLPYQKIKKDFISVSQGAYYFPDRTDRIQYVICKYSLGRHHSRYLAKTKCNR